MAVSGSGDDEPSIIMDANNVEEEDERPVSPLAQSLMALTSAAAVPVPTWIDSNALLPGPNALAIGPDTIALSAALEKVLFPSLTHRQCKNLCEIIFR